MEEERKIPLVTLFFFNQTILDVMFCIHGTDSPSGLLIFESSKQHAALDEPEGISGGQDKEKQLDKVFYALLVLFCEMAHTSASMEKSIF